MSSSNGHHPAPPATPPADAPYLLGLDVVQSSFGPAIRYTVQTAAVSASWLVKVDDAEKYCQNVTDLTAEVLRQYRRKLSGLILPSES